MRILHVITGLGNGGAEGVLYRLVTSDLNHTHSVISLQGKGVYGDQLRAKGIEVHTLSMPRGAITLRGIAQLFRVVRAFQPDLVQTWMYHADLLGGLVARFLGVKAVVWGIRGAYDKNRTTLKTKLIIYACVYMSRWIPQMIISNSEQAGHTHSTLGYISQKMKIVRNGFSFVKFQPDTMARQRVNLALNLPSNMVLLGMVARFDTYKDHQNLFKALAFLSVLDRPFVCLLIGPEMNVENKELMFQIEANHVSDKVRLLGPQEDIPGFMAALDIHVLSSAGESFPNVLAEAMACGTPCVTTAVGDASFIVDETGWVVPPSDAKALAYAIEDAMQQIDNTKAWSERKQACLERVHSKFGLENMIASYHRVWQEVAGIIDYK